MLKFEFGIYLLVWFIVVVLVVLKFELNCGIVVVLWRKGYEGFKLLLKVV